MKKHLKILLKEYNQQIKQKNEKLENEIIFYKSELNKKEEEIKILNDKINTLKNKNSK